MTIPKFVLCLSISLIFSSCMGHKQSFDSIEGAQTSPWEHSGEEVAKDANTYAPITYSNIFERERDLLAYNPRYMPNAVDFDMNNRPFMRFGHQGKLGDHRTIYKKRAYQENNLIQTLGQEDQWQLVDSQVKFLRNYLKLNKKDELSIRSGISVPERLVFDCNNRVYTIADLVYKKNSKKIFMSVVISSKDLINWQVIDLDGFSPGRLEYFVGQEAHQRIVLRGAKKGQPGIKVIDINTLRASKTFFFKPGTMLEKRKLSFNTDMAGCGNDFVSTANKTFFVYMITDAWEGVDESAHFSQAFDHKSMTFSQPQFIGYTGHSVDMHNTPAICADKDGFIHIVLGAHWNSFVYLKSKSPYSMDLEEAEYIAGNGNNSWSADGLTYIALQVDPQNVLHLVARGRGHYKDKSKDYLDYALQYFRKKPDQSWEPRKNLLIPNYRNYGNWYHRMSQDRQGRLFLQYVHYTAKLRDQELAEYNKRWPEEHASKDKGGHAGVSAHDPVLMISDNAGNSWRLAKTEDFTN